MEGVYQNLDLTTLEQYRSEAIAELHKLTLGNKLQTAGSGADQAARTPARVKELQSYISMLSSAIDKKSGKPGRQPIHIYPS